MAFFTGKMESGAGNNWTILAAKPPISIRVEFKVRLQEGSVMESDHAIALAVDQAGQYPAGLMELTTSISANRFFEQTWVSHQFK